MILNTLFAVGAALILAGIWNPPLWVGYLAIALLWTGFDSPLHINIHNKK